MKQFFKDFKEFAMKGNIVDMAIGVIIGSAFGKIVSSFVADIITPLLGLILGKVNISELKWVIEPAVGETPEVALTYGMFLQSVIDFLLIALSIFLVLRVIMNVKKRFIKEKEEAKEETPAEPSEEVVLLTEIRDALKELNENEKK